MKKITKIIAIVSFLFVIVLVMGYCFLLEDIFLTELEGKQYDSIEDLHEDYMPFIWKHTPKSEWSAYPVNIAFYVNLDDRWFVFCSYSRYKEEIVPNELVGYLVREQNGKFILETPKGGGRGWVYLPLTNEYSRKYYNDYSYAYSYNGINKSVGFAYKEVGQSTDLYYDGKKMNEVLVKDPHTGEDFILCYGESDITSNFLGIFLKSNDLHTIESR